MVLPSCAVNKIRTSFPSANYAGFTCLVLCDYVWVNNRKLTALYIKKNKADSKLINER